MIKSELLLVLALVFTLTLGACGNSGTANLGSQGTGSSTESSAILLHCEEARFLSLINLYRRQAGLTALLVSQAATEAARWHARDMGEGGYFSHTDSLGRDPSTRGAHFGYGGTMGENAAAGNASATGTFCQWKKSTGHNANMLRAEFRVIGIGLQTVQSSQFRVYWSTPFGVSTVDKNGAAAIANPRTDGGSCETPVSLPNC